MNRKAIGDLGETAVCEYLKQNGYTILDRNFHARCGEIDIIAVKDDVMCFVEVKTRSASPYLSGQYAVDQRKQFHIMRTASYYLSVTKCELQPRFDIIEVEVERGSGQMKKINHIKNAFSQTENYARF